MPKVAKVDATAEKKGPIVLNGIKLLLAKSSSDMAKPLAVAELTGTEIDAAFAAAPVEGSTSSSSSGSAGGQAGKPEEKNNIVKAKAKAAVKTKADSAKSTAVKKEK